MDYPLWVPWLLAFALAYPVVLRLGPGSSLSRRGVALALVPALAMALYSAWVTLDRRVIDQDELDEAVRAAAPLLSGTLGAVDRAQVASLVEADLGTSVWITESSPTFPDADTATYSIEVRADADSTARACLDVELGRFSDTGPGLWFADVDARSGGCG